MHRFQKILQSSLVGRIKGKVAMEISGSSSVFPSERRIWTKVMQIWRENPHYGQILFHVVSPPPIGKLNFSQSLSVNTADLALSGLGKLPPIHRVMTEGSIVMGGKNIEIACLILGHARPDESPGYYAFILEKDSLTGGGTLQFSIVPTEKEGRLSVQTTEGWREMSMDEAVESPLARAVVLSILAELRSMLPVPAEKLSSFESISEPPPDAQLTKLLRSVLANSVEVTSATVSACKLKPGSLSYFTALGRENFFGDKSLPRILVYWNGEHFVSSDDYHALQEYFASDASEVPVAVIGSFPDSECLDIIEVGGRELIPPVRVTRGHEDELSDEDKLWLAKKQLQRDGKGVDGDEMALWLVFARLIAESEDLHERRYHDFIEEHPQILAHFGDEVSSEVSLDGKYFVDLVAVRQGRLPQVYLIELERANHTVITRGRQEGAKVTHAVQQVSDWLRWWRTNRTHSLVSPYKGTDPQGVVVIGRSRDLSDEEVEILAHNNQRRDIEVITYDELLDRFGQHILASVSDEEMHSN